MQHVHAFITALAEQQRRKRKFKDAEKSEKLRLTQVEWGRIQTFLSILEVCQFTRGPLLIIFISISLAL